MILSIHGKQVSESGHSVIGLVSSDWGRGGAGGPVSFGVEQGFNP